MNFDQTTRATLLLPLSECRLQMPNPHDAVGALQPGFLFTEYQERLERHLQRQCKDYGIMEAACID